MTTLDTSQPFTYAEAIEAGITRRELAGDRYYRVIDGVYVDAEAPLTHLALVRAALKRAPNAVICGLSAARLWNVPIDQPAEVELLLPRDHRVVADGIREHRPVNRPPSVWRFGVRTTAPAATFVRLAHRLDLIQLVAAGDALVRSGVVTCEELRAAANDSRTRRSVLARRAAQLVREGVDSVQETRVRLLMVLAGMPEPEPNITFYKEDGSWEFRLDLGYREFRVAFEYDGRQHETPEAQEYDAWRRSVFEGRAWVIHSLTSDDLFIRPDVTVASIRAALDEHGIPHKPSQAWQRYFPVREKAA